MTAVHVNENIRYEPDDIPPPLVAIGAGFQAAMIIVAPLVLTVVIVARIAGQPDSYLSWGVFAALIISGATTILQAVRIGPVGAGHVLIMGTSGVFIAVCVAALVEGGPSTMASLIIVSSLFQFLLAARLSLLRRIFTPVVSGTVIMLIPVHGDADRVRYPEGRARWRVTGCCAIGSDSYPGYHRGAGAAGAGSVAAYGRRSSA